MKGNIRGRLALYFSLLITLLLVFMLAVTGTLAYGLIAELRPQVEATYKEAQTASERRTLINNAEYLGQRLFPFLYDLDISGLNQEIRQIRSWLPVRSFVITDRDGRILTDGSPTNPRYQERLTLPKITALHTAPRWQALPGGSELLFAIGARDLVVGYAQMRLSDAEMQQSLQTLDERVRGLWARSNRSILLAVALSVMTFAILAIVLTWQLSRALTRPISEMIEASSAYASGNLDVTLPIRANDELGRLALSLNSMANRLKKNSQVMHQLANYDWLTGLANRNLFHERLRQSLSMAARARTQVGLLFIDLDGFKGINDGLGHGLGDEVLKLTATRLREAVRRSDTVARLGGDEFTLIVEAPRSDHDIAMLAGKLLDALAEPFQIRERALYLSASIGIALYPRDAGNAKALLRNADLAMYSAKEQGKGTYRFFTDGLGQRAQHRLHMEHSLREAIDHEEFILHYQPQIHGASGALIGVEALLRWRRPSGLVPPDEFIPILEDTGLITRLTAWVLNEACRTIAQWHARGLTGLRIAINLSALQLQQASLLTTIEQALAETGIDPRALEVEITESTLLNAEHGQEIATALQELGVRLAIDDFGTGYSSLIYLHRFAVDTIKIDRSFVRDIVLDRDSAVITSAVITLAQQLGIETVAEGIETAAQMRILLDQGCSLIQGYLISRPLPSDELLDWVQSQHEAQSGGKLSKLRRQLP